MPERSKNDPSTLKAWCSYDMANSAYNLIISTVIFPVYYQNVTQATFGSEMLSIFGISIKNTVVYDYAIALAYLCIVLLSPFLSGIADYGGYRKRFMMFFTALGSTSCALMYYFTGSNVTFGLALVMLAVIGFAGSLVFYNSFLPIIATPDRHDTLSARGFAWGYGGSVVLLVICLLFIQFPQLLHLQNSMQAVRLSFVAVGVWWIGIAQFAFYYLHETPVANKQSFNILKGFQQLAGVWKMIRKDRTKTLFLLSFLFLSMGVQTIILVATLFGSVELQISGNKLIIIILIIQIVALLGSLFFAKVSQKKGSRFSMATMLIIWISICLSAYFIQNETQFYLLAAMVGLVLGGIQSQARAAYAKMLPADIEDTASYFSFYDITEKIGIVAGMSAFGFIESFTGNMRISALALSGFFVVSLLFILLIRNKMKVESKAL
jgi:UMF1 family MFS transporter